MLRCSAPWGFFSKWHHAAVAYRNGQLKAYIDQHRSLVVPKVGFTPVAVEWGGIGSVETPVTFNNVRIAEGGGMNMLDKLYKEGKLVTHGILFDVGKATLKPASMGTINEIVKLMQQKSDLKLEVGGHTDSDGDDASNMRLSQARVDAVKAKMAEMGIDALRLTAKGYGESKPIADNKTPEGKANNRRVEFVKK
jgi:outer membrane protein OmpA-like peptidoglycan-associated protein